MNQNKDKKYFAIIDTLRGIASLMVVIVHISFNLDKSWLTMIAAYGQHGVIIFFVISGFIIPYSLDNGKYTLQNISDFLLRRILRINPPYYVILFLTILFYIVIKQLNPNANDEYLNITGSNVLFHLTYLVPFVGVSWYNNIFWTLAVEFQYYILIALLYPLLNKNRYLLIIGMIVISFSHHLPYAKETITILNYSTPFLIGVSIYLYKSNRINKQQIIITSIALFWLCQSQISGQRMLFALFTYLGIMFSQFSSPITNFLGKISCSLYLTHSLLFMVLFSLIKKLIDFDNILFIKEILALLFIFLSIPIAYLFYIIIEKPSIAIAVKYKLRN